MGGQALAVVLLAALTRVSPVAAEPISSQARDAARRVAATVHLAAQEYALAWEGAAITHPEEAAEAKLFIGEAQRVARALPARVAPEITGELDALARLLAAEAPVDSVARHAAALERRLDAALGSALDDRPAREPSLAAGARIFASRCAQCHGSAGHGDGPAAVGLTPPPADLTLPAGTAPIAPLDYYRRLTYGVPGTAMPAFESVLAREDRWDAIAYVLSLSDTLALRTASGADAVSFGTVRSGLGAAMERAHRGERAAAADQVLEAYLEFEGVEGKVRIANAGLASRAERRFAALREVVQAGGPGIDARYRELSGTLDSAETVLGRSHTGAGLLAESFLLIVREGFEAILIVAAIMAVVLRSGTADQRRSVRWGVGLALAASLATAALLEWLLEGSAAQREALEGGVMLVAAAVLFYVSYWLVSKVEVATWQRFVREKIERAALSGSSLALAFVAFLAVYREGFETVLFYKALYVSGGAGGAAPITLGLASGGVALLAVYIGIEKFGIRIPLRPFFAVTGVILFFMAFVFAGTGVKELQEGALIPSTLVPGAPRSEFFGLYPTVQSLAVQGLIVASLLVAAIWWLVRRRVPHAERTGMPGGAGSRAEPVRRPQETR
jgi:high-affinity iron transporter